MELFVFRTIWKSRGNVMEELKKAVVAAMEIMVPNSDSIKIGIVVDMSYDYLLEQLNETKLDPIKHKSLLMEYSLWRYNILGTEGISSESYDGQSQGFREDIPKNLKRLLNKFRRARPPKYEY